jgi:hypothetical protein
MGRACRKHGRNKSSYKILVGKPEGKNLLGISSRRWGDNVKKWILRMWELRV